MDLALPDNFFDLGYTPSSLNDVSRATLVRDIHNVLEAFQPEEVLLPFQVTRTAIIKNV